MFSFDPQAYGPVCQPLLEDAPRCELGPGRPQLTWRPTLEKLRGADLFPQGRIVDARMADCCLAGLWLLQNFLDESHAISQHIDTAAGSYWHGLMHRREGDFSNAKYWFRRAGNPAMHAALHAAARERAGQEATDAAAAFLGTQSAWDPYRFVDLCQAAQQDAPAAAPLCRTVATIEWQLLFDDCFRRATGTA